MGLVVGLVVQRGKTGPAAQLTGVAKAGDAGDLGHEYGSCDAPHTVQRLDGSIPTVTRQAFVHLALGDVDLVVKDLDQPAQRAQPVALRLVQGYLVQQHLAAGAEHVV